jgi:hypothetical protein
MRSGTPRDGRRPATFRDVLSIPEFRAIYAASTLSWIGDYVAKAAITALVFDITHSAAASAAAFAISYAPWLLGGSVLVSLAERYPYRIVMVYCDLARMILMAVLALVAMPLPVELVLLFCAALFSPPFEAARSATLPLVLPGDSYVVGVALQAATSQPVQVAGYFAGASLATVNPRMALLVNSATFLVSALLVRSRVQVRPPALERARRTHLLTETVDGFRLVFASPALRSIVLLVFLGAMLSVVPEGLGAAWAAELATGSHRGLAQGLIMGAMPLGAIFGALVVTRLVPPDVRPGLLRPFGLFIPLILVPAAFGPPVATVAVLAGLCGFAMGALLPIANSQFVLALPNAYRARAFGVVQGGLQLLQGTAVLTTGSLAHGSSVSVVVGLWGLAGVGAMVLLSLSWPSVKIFADAVSQARTANAAAPVLATPPAAAPTDLDPAAANGHVAAPPEAAGGPVPNGPVTGTARPQATSSQPGTMES